MSQLHTDRHICDAVQPGELGWCVVTGAIELFGLVHLSAVPTCPVGREKSARVAEVPVVIDLKIGRQVGRRVGLPSGVQPGINNGVGVVNAPDEAERCLFPISRVSDVEVAEIGGMIGRDRHAYTASSSVLMAGCKPCRIAGERVVRRTISWDCLLGHKRRVTITLGRGLTHKRAVEATAVCVSELVVAIAVMGGPSRAQHVHVGLAFGTTRVGADQLHGHNLDWREGDRA